MLLRGAMELAGGLGRNNTGHNGADATGDESAETRPTRIVEEIIGRPAKVVTKPWLQLSSQAGIKGVDEV